MNAKAAGHCSSPIKAIAVCIVRLAIPSARLFRREMPAAHSGYAPAASGRKQSLETAEFCKSERPLVGRADIQQGGARSWASFTKTREPILPPLFATRTFALCKNNGAQSWPLTSRARASACRFIGTETTTNPLPNRVCCPFATYPYQNSSWGDSICTKLCWTCSVC
jgi:hypothetical protein